MMKIVLLERIKTLGQMGDVVTVRPGYARNFLLPQKKALRATKANLSLFDTQRAQLEATNLKKKSEAEAVAITMSNVTIPVVRQASEMGHLFGSVRATDIVSGLNTLGFTVVKAQVDISTPIKTLGTHQVTLHLHPEVYMNVNVLVAKSEEELQEQLAALNTADVV